MDQDTEKETRLNPDIAKRPILDEQPSDLIHTRRNLLIIVSIYLFGVICDVSFSPKFINENFLAGSLTETDVKLAILLITFYLFVSFWWKCNDYYRSQIILTTRNIELYSARTIDEVTENKSYREPGQYSLSAWWARTSDSMQFHYDRIEKTIESLPDPEVRKMVNLIKADTRNIVDMYRAASDKDVIDSLKYYDKSVINFVYSQKLRVYIIDFGLPFFMSVITVCILLYQLFLVKWFNILFSNIMN